MIASFLFRERRKGGGEKEVVVQHRESSFIAPVISSTVASRYQALIERNGSSQIVVDLFEAFFSFFFFFLCLISLFVNYKDGLFVNFCFFLPFLVVLSSLIYFDSLFKFIIY